MDLLKDGAVVLLLVLQKNDYEIRFNQFGDFFVYRMEMVCVIFSNTGAMHICNE